MDHDHTRPMKHAAPQFPAPGATLPPVPASLRALCARAHENFETERNRPPYYPPTFLALAHELIAATKAHCAPLTLTVHLPRWSVDQSRLDAARLGFDLAEFFTFLLSGWHGGVLDEGVDRLANNLLGDYAEDEPAGAPATA